MYILGDIGNTETKVFLVSSSNKIIKKITFLSKNWQAIGGEHKKNLPTFVTPRTKCRSKKKSFASILLLQTPASFRRLTLLARLWGDAGAVIVLPKPCWRRGAPQVPSQRIKQTVEPGASPCYC